VVFGRRRIVAIQKLSGSKKEEVSNSNLASPGRFGGPFEFWRALAWNFPLHMPFWLYHRLRRGPKARSQNATTISVNFMNGSAHANMPIRPKSVDYGKP